MTGNLLLGLPWVEDPCSEARGRKSWLPPCNGRETEEGLFSLADQNNLKKKKIRAIVSSVASNCKNAH